MAPVGNSGKHYMNPAHMKTMGDEPKQVTVKSGDGEQSFASVDEAAEFVKSSANERTGGAKQFQILWSD